MCACGARVREAGRDAVSGDLDKPEGLSDLADPGLTGCSLRLSVCSKGLSPLAAFSRKVLAQTSPASGTHCAAGKALPHLSSWGGIGWSLVSQSF